MGQIGSGKAITKEDARPSSWKGTDVHLMAKDRGFEPRIDSSQRDPGFLYSTRMIFPFFSIKKFKYKTEQRKITYQYASYAE
jgi:hypothetical protein